MSPNDNLVEEHYLEALFKVSPLEAIFQWNSRRQNAENNHASTLSLLQKITQIIGQNKIKEKDKNSLIQMGTLCAKELLTDTIPNDTENLVVLAYFYNEASLFEDCIKILNSIPKEKKLNPKVLFIKTKIACQIRDHAQVNSLKNDLGSIAEKNIPESLDAIRNLCLIHRISPLNTVELEYFEKLLQSNPNSQKIDFLRINALRYQSEQNSILQDEVVKSCSKKFDLNSDDDLKIFCNWLMKIKSFRLVLEYLPPFKSRMNKELFIIRSNALLHLGKFQMLKDELSRSPIIPSRWILSIEARLHSLSSNLNDANLTLDKLYALLGNDINMLRATCHYYESVKDIHCLLYFLQKIKHISIHKKYALNLLLKYGSKTATLDQLTNWTSELSAIEIDNLTFKQNKLYYLILDLSSNKTPLEFSRILDDAVKLNEKLNNTQSRITLALAHLRNKSPDLALEALGKYSNWNEWRGQRPAWALVASKVFEINQRNEHSAHLDLMDKGISEAERQGIAGILSSTN